LTIPRSQQVDLEATQYYHCVTRCVRQAFLCGTDYETGRDYSHRKEWLVKRMQWLATNFAINICAYAVMSNHYHLVLFVDEEQALAWSDEEVQARWRNLFPGDATKKTEQLSPEALAQKTEEWRERLYDISWYMRCLNENIACLANKEDETTGRFWEGRFKSQALLDEGALLAAMAYVDLNPIRAGIADKPEESEFTSIYERIEFIQSQNSVPNNNTSAAAKKVNLSEEMDKLFANLKQPKRLMPFASGCISTEDDAKPELPFEFSEYLEIVDQTGRLLREGKRGAIPSHLAPILERLNLKASSWLELIQGIETKFSFLIGADERMTSFNHSSRNRAFKGQAFSTNCYQAEVA